MGDRDGEPHARGYPRRGAALSVLRPHTWQVERPIEEGHARDGCVAQEHPDLTIRAVPHALTVLREPHHTDACLQPVGQVGQSADRPADVDRRVVVVAIECTMFALLRSQH